MVMNPMSGPSIVISATFTADAIEPALSFWMRELGFEYGIRIAPYNQVFQLLLDPAGALASNSDGVNVVLVRFEDWASEPPRLEAVVRRAPAGLHLPGIARLRRRFTGPHGGLHRGRSR